MRSNGFLLALLCGLGLGLLITEANLMLNAVGFSSTADGVDELGSVYPFMVGRFAVYTLLAVAPAWFARHRLPCAVGFSFVIFLGTYLVAFFSYGEQGAAWVPQLGLGLQGFGFGWLVLSFLAALAKAPNLALPVAAISGALVFKTVAGSLISALVAPAAQLFMAPILLAACVALAAVCLFTPWSLGTATVQGDPSERRGQLVQLAMLAIALAVLGGMSDFGLRVGGAGETAGAMAVRLGVSCAVVLALSYLLLARPSKLSMGLRFQLAFLVALGGFFAMAVRPDAPDGWVRLAFQTTVSVCGVFAHVLLWTAIVYHIQAFAADPYRTVGLAEATSKLAGILWYCFMGHAGVASGAIILAVAYALTTGVLFAPRALGARRGDRAAAEGEGPTVPVSLEDRCSELAARHELSARQGEVFCLLARGYPRSMIAETLSLSEGTVRTHVNAIYAKLDVHSRQELLDLVLNAGADAPGAARQG